MPRAAGEDAEEYEDDEYVACDGAPRAPARPHAGSSDDDEAARDNEMLQSACLPVGGAPMAPYWLRREDDPDAPTAPPEDADEYLRQVQWERLHCPEVVAADVEEKPARVRSRKGRSYLSLFKAEDGEMVEIAPEWKEDVAGAFRRLRARCREAQRRWEEEGLPETDLPSSHTYEGWRQRIATGGPSTDLLAKQDFLSLQHLVVVAVEAFVDAHEEPQPAEGGADAEASVDAALGASPERLELLSEWAFSALAFAGEPLVDDIQYQLQRLRRTCVRTLSPGVAEPFRAKASLLLVIVTEVFGQR